MSELSNAVGERTKLAGANRLEVLLFSLGNDQQTVGEGRIAMILDVEKVLAETGQFIDDPSIFDGLEPLNKDTTVVFADDSSVARRRRPSRHACHGLHAPDKMPFQRGEARSEFEVVLRWQGGLVTHQIGGKPTRSEAAACRPIQASANSKLR